VATASLPFGRKRPNRVADALGFGSYNKNIENPSSKFAWTSRDEEQVKKYEADGFCGNILSVNFYYYLCKGLKNLYKDVERIPRNLPVCLISGDQDPVGLYGKGTRRLYELYRKMGISDLQLKLYPGARHEILNETNRDEVYLDMAAWLIKHS
jgi:alpha-beta hydrolase superfamily lysophospholipase